MIATADLGIGMKGVFKVVEEITTIKIRVLMMIIIKLVHLVVVTDIGVLFPSNSLEEDLGIIPEISVTVKVLEDVETLETMTRF